MQHWRPGSTAALEGTATPSVGSPMATGLQDARLGVLGRIASVTQPGSRSTQSGSVLSSGTPRVSAHNLELSLVVLSAAGQDKHISPVCAWGSTLSQASCSLNRMSKTCLNIMHSPCYFCLLFRRR